MTDQAAATIEAVPPEERGTLEVRSQALQHLVETVVRRTPGTAAHKAGLGRIGLGQVGLGSSYPQASVRLQGGRARITVDVACVWPCRVTEIATRVRDEVLAQGTRLSGVEIRDVDVTAHLVPAGDDDR